MENVGDSCELLPVGSVVVGATKGACEWKLQVLRRAVAAGEEGGGSLTAGVKSLTAGVKSLTAGEGSLIAGRHLIRRLIIDSTDALGDLPPLLIRAELPALDITVEGSLPRGSGRVAVEGSLPRTAGRSCGTASLPPKGRAVASIPPETTRELVAVALHKVRLRWSSLGQERAGWQLRLRTLVALDVHDLEDLSLVPVLRESDLQLSVVSAPARNPSTGDASSLSFGLEGEHVELHVGPAAMQMVAWMAAAGCRAAPMSTRVVNETPLPLVFGQVGTLIASLISSDCLPHQLVPLVFGQVGTLIASLISSDCLPHQL
jgi:hypothetical protein